MRHSLYDLLMNFGVIQAAQDACDQGRDQACVDRQLEQHFVPLNSRMDVIAAQHRKNVDSYAADYRRGEAVALPLDTSASMQTADMAGATPALASTARAAARRLALSRPA